MLWNQHFELFEVNSELFEQFKIGFSMLQFSCLHNIFILLV